MWRWIREQEYDAYRSGPLKKFKLQDFINDKFPDRAKGGMIWRNLVETCLINIEPFETADDHFCAQLVSQASEWLEGTEGNDREIFMWVDSFDPHEPWTPPSEFDKYTDPDYKGKRYILPPGGPSSDYFTEEEINCIRGLYAGEVAYVDHYIGKLLYKLEELGYFYNSLIILISDHGHPLSDHGKFLKGPDRMYNELLKVMFMIRFPKAEYGGQRLDALSQFHDILPTILDVIELRNNLETLQGRSLMPLIKGETKE